MGETSIPAILAWLVILQAAALAQPLKPESLTQVDCTAFQKLSDGSYLVTKDTKLVDTNNNTISVAKGVVVGPNNITFNGVSALGMIDQACAHANPAPGAPQPQPPAPSPLPPPQGSGASAPPVGAPAINLVGEWSFQFSQGNVSIEGIYIFQASGVYNEFVTYPQSPIFGNQVIQFWGTYTLNGTTLTETPTGGEVSYGPNPKEICDVQNGQCQPLDLTPQSQQVQAIDANTLKVMFQTFTVTATRMK